MHCMHTWATSLIQQKKKKKIFCWKNEEKYVDAFAITQHIYLCLDIKIVSAKHTKLHAIDFSAF